MANPFNLTALKPILIAWANANNGESIDFEWAEQNAPRAITRPYGTLKILSARRVGEDYYTSPVGDAPAIATASLLGTREFTLIIEILGHTDNFKIAQVYDTLEALRVSMYSTPVIDTFMEADLVTYNNTDIVDLTMLLDTQYIPRAQFEMMFRVTSLVEDIPVGAIESVSGIGTIEDGVNGDIQIDLEVNT